jgi:hypothetical protein
MSSVTYESTLFEISTFNAQQPQCAIDQNQQPTTLVTRNLFVHLTQSQGYF